MIKKETVLTGAAHPHTKLEVIRTNAGCYLGFRDADGTPYSRETYYMTRTEAEHTLGLIRRATPTCGVHK